MSSFAAWGITILGLAVVATVAEMLLPKGRTRGVIRSVTATLATLVIVAPLPELFERGAAFDFSGGSVETDGEYIEFVDEMRADLIERSACEYLSGKGYDGISVSVRLDGWNVISATAKFVDSGITEDYVHIHKSEITLLLAEYFGIDEEAVMVYG